MEKKIVSYKRKGSKGYGEFFSEEYEKVRKGNYIKDDCVMYYDGKELLKYDILHLDGNNSYYYIWVAKSSWSYKNLDEKGKVIGEYYNYYIGDSERAIYWGDVDYKNKLFELDDLFSDCEIKMIMTIEEKAKMLLQGDKITDGKSYENMIEFNICGPAHEWKNKGIEQDFSVKVSKKEYDETIDKLNKEYKL